MATHVISKEAQHRGDAACLNCGVLVVGQDAIDRRVVVGAGLIYARCRECAAVPADRWEMAWHVGDMLGVPPEGRRDPALDDAAAHLPTWAGFAMPLAYCERPWERVTERDIAFMRRAVEAGRPRHALDTTPCPTGRCFGCGVTELPVRGGSLSPWRRVDGTGDLCPACARDLEDEGALSAGWRSRVLARLAGLESVPAGMAGRWMIDVGDPASHPALFAAIRAEYPGYLPETHPDRLAHAAQTQRRKEAAAAREHQRSRTAAF